MLVELLAIVFLCVLAALRTPVFGSGDEGYHLSYAVDLAEGRGLPVVGQTLVQPEVLALQDGVYPAAATARAEDLGFRGLSYEGFQPPLFYALAAPVSALSDDWRTKVTMVRLLSVALLAVGLVVLTVLCRLVRPEDPLPLLAVAAAPLLFPAVREQEILVGNDVLLIPLTLGFACCAWTASRRRSPAALWAAGLLAGLMLLTKLTSVWAVPVLVLVGIAVLRAQDTARGRTLTVLGTAAPGLMLLPWIALNLDRYGSLTANDLVLRLQAEVSPPTDPSVLTQAQEVLRVLVQVVLGRRDEYPGWVTLAAGAVGLLLLISSTVIALGRLGPRPVAVVLALPLVLQVALLCALSVLQGTQLLYERYLHPVVPLTVIAAFVVVRSRRASSPAG